MNDNLTDKLLDNLYVEPILTKNDEIKLLNIALEKLHGYVNENVLKYSDESFHENLENELIDEILFELENIMSYSLSKIVRHIVDEAINIYFIIIIPALGRLEKSLHLA